jgi:hypothetical protein
MGRETLPDSRITILRYPSPRYYNHNQSGRLFRYLAPKRPTHPFVVITLQPDSTPATPDFGCTFQDLKSLLKSIANQQLLSSGAYSLRSQTSSMARPRFEHAHEVMNLASDGEEEVFSGDELDFFDAVPNGDDAVVDLTDMSGVLEEHNARYNPAYGAADDGIIDLTAIPDIDVPPSDDPILIEDGTRKSINEIGGADLVTEAACLQMVLNVLPEISIEYVLNLIKEKTADLTRTVAQCEGIVTQLLDGDAYPKEVDEAKNNKRKRDVEEEDWSTYEKGEQDPALLSYETEA